jgi:hypothetical protein
MKKIFALILVLSVLFTLTACQKKTPLTEDAFTEIMEDIGYDVMDVTQGFDTSGYDVTVLYSEDDDIQIWFYVFDKTKDANSVFSSFKSFCDNLGGSKATTSVNLGNFGKFTCSVNGDLYVGACIDNTFVHIETTKDQKDNVNDILEALGYK